MGRIPANCRIAMDGRMLVPMEATGVGTYARGLQQALAKIIGRPLILSDRPSLYGPVPGHRVTRWLNALSPLPRRAIAHSDDKHELLLCPDVFRLAQVHFDIHRRLLAIRVAGPPGIVHWTYPIPLRIDGWSNLYTIHDVIPLLDPELSPIDPIRHRRLLDGIIASAAALVTVSDASAADIVRVLGLPASRIHNCGQAVAPEPSGVSLPDGLEAGRYLLAVGSVERRKNLEALIEAYRASGAALPLVIAGPDGWGAAPPAASGILRLRYQPEPALRALIGQARALLMPSLAEGFGLPVVEAMALGTPVMTSGQGALAEIAGGAAIMVDPHNMPQMTAAIARLASDDALCGSLALAGKRNAERFTLDRFVEKLDTLYAHIAQSMAA